MTFHPFWRDVCRIYVIFLGFKRGSVFLFSMDWWIPLFYGLMDSSFLWIEGFIFSMDWWIPLFYGLMDLFSFSLKHNCNWIPNMYMLCLPCPFGLAILFHFLLLECRLWTYMRRSMGCRGYYLKKKKKIIMHRWARITKKKWLLQLIISSPLIHAFGNPSQAPTGIWIRVPSLRGRWLTNWAIPTPHRSRGY